MSDRAREFEQQLARVRPVTRHFIESVLQGQVPNDEAIIAFGIDNQKHIEALAIPLQSWEITPQMLDDALGDGKRLTAMTRAAASNPHRKSDLAFETLRDQGYDMKSLFQEIQADTAARAQEDASAIFNMHFGATIRGAANDNRRKGGIKR
jgi:hypothetical protein